MDNCMKNEKEELSTDLTGFEHFAEKLSVRAKRALRHLGVSNPDALMRITTKELKGVWSCGESTIAEIERFQEKLSSQRQSNDTMESEFDFEAGNDEKQFHNLIGELSVRAKHVLANIGVSDSDSLLRLTHDDLEKVPNCGKKTITEIETFQLKLRKKDPSFSKYNSIKYEEAPREVFEAVLGVLGIRSTNILNDLNIVGLKFFMALNKKQLLNCRNCGRKTSNEILHVQSGIAEYVRKQCLENDDFSMEQLIKAPCLAYVTATASVNAVDAAEIFADIENPAEWLINWIQGLAGSKKKARAFMLRKGMSGLPPMTLDTVGMHLGGITRERVRQMVASVEKNAISQQHRLSSLVDAAATIVSQHGGMVSVDELKETLLCKGNEGNQLKYASKLVVFLSGFKIWKDAGLVLQDGAIANASSKVLFHRLAGVVVELAETVADEKHSVDIWSADRKLVKAALLDHISTVSETTTLKNLSESFLDSVLKQNKKRLKTRKDRIYSLALWRLRFGKITQMLDTALFQIGKPAHYSEIADYVWKWRATLSERNIHAALTRCDNALLWDRGTFVHKEKIVLPFSLVHDVEKWFLEKLCDDVPFVSVNGAFQRFRNRCERAGMISDVALYSCLRQSAHPRLLYPKLPFVYLRKGYRERIPLVLAFENFLRDAGGPVTQQEAKEFGLGKMFLKEYQLNTLGLPNVFRTNDRGYLHMDNAELDDESIQSLISYTQKVISTENHCSVDKIYNEKKVTCRSAGIEGPVMLYSVFKHFAEELFDLNGYPRVACSREDRSESKRTIKKWILDFLRDYGRPCPHEALEERFVEELGYREYQLYSAVRDPEVFMYHSGCVIHNDSLAWNESKQNDLEKEALRLYQDAVLGGMYFGRTSHLVESTDLPDLPNGLHWSRTLISELLTRSNRYLVLGNKREAFIPRKNEQSINNFESLVGKLLSRDWGGAANHAKFETSLVKAGIIKRYLTPSMLGSGRLVVIRNGEIVLKELMSGAQTS